MGVHSFVCGEVRGGVLHSSLGPLRLEGGAPDGPALYAIRPEHLRLIGAPGPNAVAAQVEAESFRGAYSELRLLACDVPLRAHLHLGATAGAGPLYVQLPPEHLFPVIDDDPSERKESREHT